MFCLGCDSGGVNVASLSDWTAPAAGDVCCGEAGGGPRATDCGPGDETASRVRCGCLRIRIFGDPPVVVLTPGTGSGPRFAASVLPCEIDVSSGESDLVRLPGQRGPPPGAGSGTGRTLLTQRTCLLI